LHLRIQHLGNVVLCRRGRRSLFIERSNAHASLGRHLGNTAPHGAGADDADDEVGSIGIEGHC